MKSVETYNEQISQLCLALIKADTEEEVITLLRTAGYWDNPKVWRLYGDRENYNTIGNQQSRPDAALVEKLVNSIDAELMNACYFLRIDPRGPDAPKTIREAVEKFFSGRVAEWPDSKRTEVAKNITLAATGASPREGNPCFTISDCGEGQTPEMMPKTLLSLDRTNKHGIPFVQGKFNMGGSGVLKHCSHRHNLQLILSRRNPALMNSPSSESSETHWGFTVVRREEPGDGRWMSHYTFLAPINADAEQQKGSVLHFFAKEMPLFPEGRNAYARISEWGTLIKLYEYSAFGYSNTHILRKDGLLSRLDILLSELALPIRLHECRQSYRGHGGSFDTTLTGLTVRLEADKGDNLEEGFPSSSQIVVEGETMMATIYAFKKGKAETYRKNEGVIFTLNGQTHAQLTADFYRRKAVGLSYLADSILVVVDCSGLSGRAREDLFMTSRDRMSHAPLRGEIEKALEDLLKHNGELRTLKEQRRHEEIEAKLEGEKPLEEILESLLKKYPTLSSLFLPGTRISNPFKPDNLQSEEKAFKGKRFPTYFLFKGKEYGVVLQKDCPINMRSRITFKTDAVNDYFARNTEPGQFSLSIVSNEQRSPVTNYVGPNLQNGVATLSLSLPTNSKVTDTLQFEATVTDPSRIEPFANRFVIHVKEPASLKPRKRTNQQKKDKSSKNEKGQELITPSGIALPKITLVSEEDWEKHSPAFDKYTALRILNAGTIDDDDQNGDSKDVYDFYVNKDNIYLKSEMKSTSKDYEILRAQFIYGMVLLGLAMLQEETQNKKTIDEKLNDDEEKINHIEDQVEQFTKAVAPILVPMIDSLGAIELDSFSPMDASGEAV